MEPTPFISIFIKFSTSTTISLQGLQRKRLLRTAKPQTRMSEHHLTVQESVKSCPERGPIALFRGVFPNFTEEELALAARDDLTAGEKLSLC